MAKTKKGLAFKQAADTQKEVVSNQKKKRISEQLREQYAKRGISSFEKKVMIRMQQHVRSGEPFDRKQQEAYFSGALYGYEQRNQMWQTKALYILIGCGATLFGEAVYLMFKYLVS